MIEFKHFATSHIGQSHVEHDKPCQDYAVSIEHSGAIILAAADGHGGSRYFRSQIGSRIACEEVVELLKEAAELAQTPPRMESFITDLKQRLITRWYDRIISHLRENPITHEEIELISDRLKPRHLQEVKDGRFPEKAYGSTISAVLIRQDFWLALQLGDGLITIVEPNGKYLWPLPESNVNIGHFTASLCMENPHADFRHSWGVQPLSGAIICTDGVEKAYPASGEELLKLMHWLWCLWHDHADTAPEQLEQYLEKLTKESAAQDDASFSLAVDTQSPGCDLPSRTAPMILKEQKHILKLLDEVETIIAYNTRQLQKQIDSLEDQPLGDNGSDVNTNRLLSELRDSIGRNEKEKASLEMLLAKNKAELEQLPPSNDKADAAADAPPVEFWNTIPEHDPLWKEWESEPDSSQ